MEPDDLATSEKLERLQQHRQRRAAPAEDDDEAALEDVDGELESAEARFTRNRRQLPYIIYPEVLVIIDYDGYRLHGGDNLQVSIKLVIDSIYNIYSNILRNIAVYVLNFIHLV